MENDEQKLIVLLGRYTFDEHTIKEIEDLLEHKIEWNKVLEYAISCKCIGLIYFNLIRLGLMVYIKPIIYYIFKYYYYGNKLKNIFLMEEKTRLLDAFRRNHIVVYPLKGARLLSEIYIDLGSRTMNDLDFLCKLEDRNIIDDVMREMGYRQGEFDWREYSIKKIERSKMIGWKINMNTLPTYLKIPPREKTQLEYIAIDFSYALNLKKDVSITKKIFENGLSDNMDSIDFLLHLCCHLYKEAEEDIWIEAAADVNLIKFCDIREFLIHNFSHTDDEVLSTIVLRAVDYGCWEDLYFALYFLLEIYNDDISEKIMGYIRGEGLELKATKYHKLDGSEAEREAFYKRLFAFKNMSTIENVVIKGEPYVEK